MPRINLTKAPFNHQRSRTQAVTIRDAGEYEVGETIDEDVAEAAVAKGHAKWIDGAEKPKPAAKKKGSPKKPATKPAKAITVPVDAATDTGSTAGVDREDLAPNDSADGSAPVVDAG